MPSEIYWFAVDDFSDKTATPFVMEIKKNIKELEKFIEGTSAWRKWKRTRRIGSLSLPRD